MVICFPYIFQGQLATASHLFSRISSSVASEQHYFWLVALSDMTKAESISVQGVSTPLKPSEERNNLAAQLYEAIQLYHQAVTYLTVSVRVTTQRSVVSIWLQTASGCIFIEIELLLNLLLLIIWCVFQLSGTI